MKNLTKAMLVIAAGTVFSVSANAGWGSFDSHDRPYAGLKVAQFSQDADESGVDIDDTVAYGAYAGYTFDSGFGFEAQYLETEDADVELKGNGGAKGEIENKAFGLSAVYKHHPKNYSGFYFKGSLGAISYESTLKANGNEYEDDGTDWTAGAGFGYDMSSNSSIELTYERLHEDADMVALAANMRF